MMGAKTLYKAYAAPGLVMRDDAGVLADVMLDPVQVAVWDRHSPLDQQVVQLACREKLAVKSWLDVADLPASMMRSLPGEDFAPLREDLALLADMMACLFGATGVGLRVTALEKPMCPRFHVDQVPCRLITTFAGPATQWLEENSLNRSKLGRGSNGQPDSSSGLIQANANIQKITVGDVALLKGERWEGNEGRGIVHRSPGVEQGQQRLLLTLDMA